MVTVTAPLAGWQHKGNNMTFKKAINIWALTENQIKALQPGQWVTAGGNLGRFYGVKKSGSVVVAWSNNAKNSGNYFDYCKTLYQYARG
jgi:hypothetical protein